MEYDIKDLKRRAVVALGRWLQDDSVVRLLGDIDERVVDYYEDLVASSEGDTDRHNFYELAGGLRLLRLMRRYVVDVGAVRRAIRLREGRWKVVDGKWVHIDGGLKLPGTGGETYYRWEPFQVVVLTALYGVSAWVDTRVRNGERGLLPTERDGVSGTIEDLRRLCTDLTFFAPRKVDKTGLASYVAMLFFMMGDHDAEIYCCANSQSQSKLLYDRARRLIHQMDPKGRVIRFTSSEVNWKDGQIRNSLMQALSAGGKTKDGLFAQLCCADEFGSAGYVNGKSDMGALVNVVASSMGPRREPLLLTTTTAGTIEAGPFMEKLEGMKRVLRDEVVRAESILSGSGEGVPEEMLTDTGDRWWALVLEPDEWEQCDEELLLHDRRVRLKVNPMLGKIVQHAFYDDQVGKAEIDQQRKAEVLTKLLNVYRSGRATSWIRAEEIRPLQMDRRIDDCLASEGWVVFCGMDFSKGDDLHAMSYLAARHRANGGIELFADMDSWMTEAAIDGSSVRGLWELWVKQGWLRVSPGKVLQGSLPVMRIAELLGKGVQFQAWGYDSYQSLDPINTLKAYLSSELGVARPEKYVVPVSQSYASYNPAVLAMEHAVRCVPALIGFSQNPLWPYEFGCCKVDEDLRMGNRKMLKATPGSDACKIDNVQCLATALLLEMRYEGGGVEV